MFAKEALPKCKVWQFQFRVYPSHQAVWFLDTVTCLVIILHYLASVHIPIDIYLPKPSYLDMAVVTCLAVIPPELGKDNFGLPAKILYVPAGSVEVYRKNAVWREAFETIAALP